MVASIGSIEENVQFKRDFKREAKGRHRNTLGVDLPEALKLLANDEPLPEHYQDHSLSGDWIDHWGINTPPTAMNGS